nr:InlB B-repeat-containing protein [Candidatus Enterousia merdequi]
MSIIFPSYSDISSGAIDASCDSETLGSTGGDVTLAAEWNPNTINLKWYDGKTEIVPTNESAKTCSYGGGITLPENTPTKTGYNLVGWVLKEFFRLSSLADQISVNGTSRGYSRLNGDVGSNEALYGIVRGSGDWVSEFSYGLVRGFGKCSTSGGADYIVGNPVDTKGGVCWCKANAYDATKTGNYEPIAETPMVLVHTYKATSDCTKSCAYTCSYYVMNDGTFRKPVYGIPE